MAFLGHLGPLQRLRPVVRDSRSVSRSQKGPKGATISPQGQVGLKPQLDPPEPNLVTNPLHPKLAKDLLDTNLAINPVGPIFGHGPPWTIFPAMASGNHQRQPDQLSKLFPQLKGKSFLPPCTPYSRLQEWCISGIIYHYAPFLLSNSMVKFSGPNSTITNQGPKIQFPFQSRIL
ncbi:hypothetical protein O181_088707 [Austropuccinia psidii MF-1]|uniref:Uncharacterized protein n=1 Tax=Austropuccinia psidii MF-1 TaxID=1389203 RepID=A0A9Q3P5K3_9BASI|nr:hypothetical protein [Austropuccinia psidii MF-1]